MNPLKHKLANEWMRQDDASPEEALETWNTMEAEFKLNRALTQEPRITAQEPRNMYQDGQLVRNTVDGSRPGYKGEEFSLEKNLSKVPPKIRERFIKVNNYLKKIIPELNASEKYVTKEQVSSMVEEKFNIKPKYKTTMPSGKGDFPSSKKKYVSKVSQFETKSYPVLKNLDSVETKIENTLKNMLIEKKPLNDFWYKALAERTGLDHRTLGLRIGDSPTYKVIKDQGAGSLKNRFNKLESHSFLKELSFSDQLTTALEMEQGMPRYTGMGKEKYFSSSPKFKVFEFAKRNFHRNKGNGAVKYFTQDGKKIKWSYGVELPYKNVYFTYDGKKYSASDKIKNTNNLTDINILKKHFPEVYKNQTAMNNLVRQKIDNPYKTGDTVGDLVKAIQVNNYEWPRISTFDILHGKKGVKGEPFTNLSFNTRDINQLEMGINQSTTLSKTQKNNLIKSINKLAGSGDPKAIIKRQLDLAADFKAGNIKSYADMKNKFLKDAGFPIDKCLSSGGRVGFANPAGLVKGSNQCIIGVIDEEMKLAKKSGNMAKFSKFGKLAKGAGYLFGWADIPIELAFALPSLLAGDVQGAKRATTAGLFGYGGKKLDEIDQEKNPEVYKYFKHVQDINDWMDAFNKEKIAESKLEELPEGYAEIYKKHGDKSGYTDFHLKQYNEAVAKQEDVTKNYIGYATEEGEEDLKAQEIARQGAQEYLGKEVKKGWKEGMDLDLFLPPSMRVAKDVFGLETKKVAPFKPDKITNLEDLIKQKGDPFYGKWWKRGTRYAAEELGAEEKLYGDWAERQFGKKDPEDIYSELPLEYASQLAALEKKEVMKDPEYKYVYRKPWEGIGYASGGLANLTRTVAPDSEGIMSLKKK